MSLGCPLVFYSYMLHHFCFEKPVASPAIYAFVSPDRRTVYYIGQSVNVVERLKSHDVKRYLKKCSIPFDFCWKVFSEDTLMRAEKAYILRYKPVLNTYHNFDVISDLKASYALYTTGDKKYSFGMELPKKEPVTFNLADASLLKTLSDYCDYGTCLIAIRESFAASRLSEPLQTDLGTFRSFNHFLTEKGEECLGISRRTAYNYIKLAENWDIVLKLGMQDISKDKLPNAMRVSRTLQIVSWYKKKVKAGADPDTLTLDLYWAEDKAKGDKKASLPYDELKKERDYYKERCEILEEQLLEAIK